MSERDRQREREKDRDRESERERERETGRDFSEKKQAHKKVQTKDVDNLLVTLLLCLVQRCMNTLLRRARGRLVADKVS